MPWWLERLVLRNAGIEYVPVLTCVGGALAVWWWQRSRAPRGAEGGGDGRVGGGPAVRVGWGPGLAVVALVLLALAWLGHAEGMWLQVWTLVQDDAWLAAWWVMGVGVTVGVWGVAVHAWRGESRLARRCRCGYDMTGVNGLKCPECGREARSERALRPFNVRRWALWAGTAVILAGLLLPTGLSVWLRGWAAGLPSRTLLWWATATSNPPEAVMREAAFRGGRDPVWWSSQVNQRCEALIERMVTCGKASRDGYVALIGSLQRAGFSEEFDRLLSVRARSVDPQRQRNATALMVALGRGSPPLAAVEEMLNDPDPVVQADGVQLIPRAAGEILARIDGRAGRYQAETDTERVRAMLRMLSQIQPNRLWAGPDALERCLTWNDPEIAARAAVIRCAWTVPNTGETVAIDTLRSAMLGVKTLRDLRLPPVRCGTGLATALWRQDCVPAVLSLLEDSDLTVRSEAAAELDTETKLLARYFTSGWTNHWTPMAGRIEAAAERESDPATKAALMRIAARFRGKGGPRDEAP